MSITGRRNLKALLYVEIVQLFMDEMLMCTKNVVTWHSVQLLRHRFFHLEIIYIFLICRIQRCYTIAP